MPLTAGPPPPPRTEHRLRSPVVSTAWRSTGTPRCWRTRRIQTRSRAGDAPPATSGRKPGGAVGAGRPGSQSRIGSRRRWLAPGRYVRNRPYDSYSAAKRSAAPRLIPPRTSAARNRRTPARRLTFTRTKLTPSRRRRRGIVAARATGRVRSLLVCVLVIVLLVVLAVLPLLQFEREAGAVAPALDRVPDHPA